MIKTRVICIVSLALAASSAGAQQVYKSIDAEGKVTYSSSPPATAEIVEQVPIAAPPSEAAQQEAEKRLHEVEKEATRGEKQRTAQQEEKRDAVAAAEKERDAARIALEEAKIKGDDDWQRINTGGRALKQGYLDRVQEAEERLKAAESALRKARRGR